MSSRVALTEQQKARLFDRLVESDVIRWRVGPRAVEGKTVERTWIERGDTNDMLVVED